MIPTRSIILVSFREADHLRRIVPALEREFPDQQETEFIVVDNEDNVDLMSEARQLSPRLHILEPKKNLYYGQANNLAAQKASGEWLLILNTDIAWSAGVLRNFTAQAEQQHECVIAAPRLIYPDGRVQISAHHAFPSWWSVFVDYCLPLQQLLMRTGRHPLQRSAAQHAQTSLVAHVTGACLYVRRAVFLQEKGFDPIFTMYLEETDFQRRLQEKHIQPLFIAETSLTHYGSAQKSFAQASPMYIASLAHYVDRWWRGPFTTARWQISCWLGSFISLVFLLLLLIPSLVLGQSGSRIRHYLGQYLRAMQSLMLWRPS